ncbi:MAG: hypothetical protein IPL46_20010 [Saprospiraceae bacterium]|nr:hypothetical protein [Saprospiraceae bacterium]
MLRLFKKLTIFFLSYIPINEMIAQQILPDIISASGDIYKINNIQLQWTLGEMLVDDYINTTTHLGQGFHHGDVDGSGTTAIIQNSLLNFIDLFPNPASSQLYLQAGQYESLRYIITNAESVYCDLGIWKEGTPIPSEIFILAFIGSHSHQTMEPKAFMLLLNSKK